MITDIVTTQNQIDLENLARESIQYGVSVQATVSLATALLIDVGIITKDDSTMIIDKNKVQQAQDKVMKKMTEEGIEHLENHIVSWFWFDRRKDNTKVILVNEDDEEFPGVRKETHYTIVEEPGGEYLTHLTPEGGKG